MKLMGSARKNTRSSGLSSDARKGEARFVVCVRNTGYPASLELRKLYRIRVRFTEVFDTANNRRTALYELIGLFLRILDEFPEMESFIVTFETWQDEILNYFEARQTSGPVEGINNKARVIIKRAYGLKSCDSLWTRLVLDLN